MKEGHATSSTPLDFIKGHLTADDDPDLWRVVLETVFVDLAVIQTEPALVEIGCCSHWLRPHQTRWTADGGFAWPTGYGRPGGGGFSRNGLPEVDWSVRLAGTGNSWIEAADKPACRRCGLRSPLGRRAICKLPSTRSGQASRGANGDST